MPFQRLLCPSNPPTQLFWGDHIHSKRKGSGMEADASLSGASRQCPLSLLPAVTRPFHRSCTEQGNAVSVQRSGSRYLLSGIAGESPWGSPGKFFRHPIGPKPPALPRFPSGRLYSHSEGRITFCKDVFPWMLCLSGIAERITSGADPLLSPSEALELARLPESATLDILSVAGLARAARKPAAAFTCGIINAKSGVALKTALSAPNQRIIKRIPPSILSMTRIRCCAAPKSSPPTMSTASAS